MPSLEARLRLEQLNDTYGPLLTERQREVVLLHFYEDLSLGEIAERLGVSRPAVADHLKRSEEFLEQCEARLGFLAKELAVRAAVSQAISLLECPDGGAVPEQFLQLAIAVLKQTIE